MYIVYNVHLLYIVHVNNNIVPFVIYSSHAFPSFPPPATTPNRNESLVIRFKIKSNLNFHKSCLMKDLVIILITVTYNHVNDYITTDMCQVIVHLKCTHTIYRDCIDKY